MNSNRLYNQVMTIFGGLMSFFYAGLGLYIIFSPVLVYVDQVLRVIFGATMILYGLYRMYRTYIKVVEVFFTDEDSE